MKDRVYTTADLHDGFPRDRAAAHPEAWAAFAALMLSRHYGHEPLNDAWLWFAEGWIKGAQSGLEYT